MQTTNQDISAMLDCVSDMFGGVSVFIHYEANKYVYSPPLDSCKTKCVWMLSIHTPCIIQRRFDFWSELSAWVRSQDKDFSEQVIIGERSRDEERKAEVVAAMEGMFKDDSPQAGPTDGTTYPD